MATHPHDIELYDEIAGTPRRPHTGCTYDDLLAFPEDNVRREVIGGELILAPSPSWRHQQVVAELVFRLRLYAGERGGDVLPGPMDVLFTPSDVVQPDVLFLGAESDIPKERPITGPPDLVIEVSSPSTRRLDLKRKRALYEAHGVPEYWYVDLDADSVHVYRLAEGRYDTARIASSGDRIEPPRLPGLQVAVDDIFGATGP